MPLILKLLQPVFNLIVSQLKKHQEKTGLLPLHYFYALCGIFPTTAIELLVLRGEGSAREILLTRRPANDPYWPSLMHFPGTVIRNGDSLGKALERCAKEIGISAFSKGPTFIGFETSRHERGQGTSIFFMVDATDAPGATGEFHPIHNLPKDIIGYQAGQLDRLGLLTK